MKRVVLVFLAVAIVAPVVFWVYGNYANSMGRLGSLWLIENMWGVRYFGARSADFQDFESVYLKSLGGGSSKDQFLIDYVVNNKCYDSSWRCSVIMTAASNLMLDNGKSSAGLRGAVEAYDRIRGGCSIALESTVVSYHLRRLSSGRQDGKAVKAEALLGKIKRDGGVLADVRSEACRKLILSKPEYFTAYALLVARLMALSGGENAYSAAYIDSLEK